MASPVILDGLYWYTESAWDFERLVEAKGGKIRFNKAHAFHSLGSLMSDARLVPAGPKDAELDLGTPRDLEIDES